MINERKPIIKFINVIKIYLTVSLNILVFPPPILYPMIGMPPSETPITIDTRIQNTFTQIPINAKGIIALYRVSVEAIVIYPYLPNKY